VASVCALLVSGATVLLRPIQTANRAAKEQIRIETLVSGIPGMADLLAQAGGTLSTAVIDLATGQATTAVTPDTLAAALADTSNWTALSSDADIAGLGRRPNFAQVFLLRDGADISLVLLPISGMGYGGRIDAFIALRSDMNTIAGITVTSHSETPGLGGRIEEAAWQAGLPGTELRDTAGDLRFAVARAQASSPYEVDGITGATRTGLGVTGMVRFWLGPDGYGPLIQAIERGEF